MKFSVENYAYENRIGNLHAEAVGVVKGKKYFPVFEGNRIFKPLTKSKPFSNPLFAYAEVFWSRILSEYFMPAPKYELAICAGYEEAEEKYDNYGTVVPCICGEGEHLVNLLEYFRAHPDPQVDIDQYVNYCQMFYDYTPVFQSAFFQENKQLAEQLAMHVLAAILKGDQNYHYENVAFLCDASNQILALAPMIDHEFSTYFMFPDHSNRNLYWYLELKKSIAGTPVQPGEYDDIQNETERALQEKSAVSLHQNLCYIREHYPSVVTDFLKKLSKLEHAIQEKKSDFILQPNPQYPGKANSDAYLIGKARYKDHDEEKAKQYEEKYANAAADIDFAKVSDMAIREIQGIITDMRRVLDSSKGDKSII